MSPEIRAKARLQSQDVQSIPLGYTYDKWDLVLTFRGADGFWARFTRDDDGHELTFINSVGDWCENTFDGAGYLISEKSGNLNQNSDAIPRIHYLNEPQAINEAPSQ